MGDAVKQAIFEELNVVLKDPGQKNEERLNQLKFTESKFCKNRHVKNSLEIEKFNFYTDYGIYLAELTLDETLDPGLRQLASVLLKKYVDEHWSPGEKKIVQNFPALLLTQISFFLSLYL
jgi:hypothetical protein